MSRRRGVERELGVIMECSGYSLCQKRLRLIWKVDECQPLPVGAARPLLR